MCYARNIRNDAGPKGRHGAEMGSAKWMDWKTFCSIHFQLSFPSCIMDDASVFRHCLLILIRGPGLLNNKTEGQNETVSELLRDTCWLECGLYSSQRPLMGIVAYYITACRHTHTRTRSHRDMNNRNSDPHTSTHTQDSYNKRSRRFQSQWAELQRHGKLFLAV